MSRNGCLSLILTLFFILTLIWWSFLREAPDVSEARESDAGNYSFVRQMVPLLQGRKVKGYDEIKVLADLIAETDRGLVIDVMTSENDFYTDEYIENWADIIVDWMRAHRQTKSQSTCFGSPRISTNTANLASYIYYNTPDASSSGYSEGGTPVDFNMSDVLRSSLKWDNLAPAYLAYLFPLVNKPLSGAEIIEQNKRADLGATLTHVYTHRQMTCMGCHNSVSSTTGPESFWNRHYPVFGNFEKAIYGSNTGRDSREVEALLRTTVSGSNKPWGMEDCGSFRDQASMPDDTLTHPDTGTFLESYFVQSHGRQGSVWNLEEILHNGVTKLASSGLVRGPDGDTQIACQFCESSCSDGMPVTDPAAAAREAAVQTLVNERCVTCHLNFHDGWAGANWKDSWIADGLVVPGDAASSTVISRVTSTTSRMPPSFATGSTPGGTALNTPLTPTEVDVIRDWINGLTTATGDCGMCSSLLCDENLVDGEAAFAHTVASKIVSNTWSEIFGPQLTIPNYFSRSSGQGSIMWNYTENVFIPNNWSLKSIIKEMLTSEYFNRKPPLTSAGDFTFEMPLFFDPWVEGDPRFPPRALPGWEPGSTTSPTPDASYSADTNVEKGFHNNAMTEAIHRYTPRSLLYSIHAGLGWPAPPRFSSSAYPNDELRKSIGQFWRDAEPGFKEVDFQGLLMWESVHGRCNKPSGFTGDDWIDKLITKVVEFNAANPGADITHRDLALILKDWVLGYGHIQTAIADNPQGMTQTEHQLLTSLFGTLNDPALVATTSQQDALETKMRDYCGALVETPQFMLTGIAPTELGEKPRLRVCNNETEACSYQEICETFRPYFSRRSISLACNENSLSVDTPLTATGLVDFCRQGFCGFIERPIDVDCLLQPETCPSLPACDPTCATIDCCGGPLPPLDRPGFMLGQAEGALVKDAQGIKIKHAGKQMFVDLKEGEVLKAGDLLALEPKGRLSLKTKDEVFQTPKQGIPAKNGKGNWYFMVTGASAQQIHRAPKVYSKVPKSYIYRALNAPWLKYGEAGAPVMGGQVEEKDPDRLKHIRSEYRQKKQ